MKLFLSQPPRKARFRRFVPGLTAGLCGGKRFGHFVEPAAGGEPVAVGGAHIGQHRRDAGGDLR
ncbi:MAG: hypothetical protein U1E35_08385 [Rhodospirillales bacterium]